jgi:hypothetical protein
MRPRLPSSIRSSREHAPVEVVLGDIHHQAQVVLDHALAGREIALTHQECKTAFLIRG